MGSASERNEEALRLFSEYLTAREQGGLDFESWVSMHTERGGELRAMHAAWLRARALLPASPGRAQGADEPREALGASLEGGLEVLEELGRGGMAIVYRARDKHLERQVAIKVLPFSLAFDAEFVERFTREARTSAQLEHPNIIPIYRVGKTGRVIHFVMKFLRGGSLSRAAVRKASARLTKGMSRRAQRSSAGRSSA